MPFELCLQQCLLRKLDSNYTFKVEFIGFSDKFNMRNGGNGGMKGDI